MPEIIDGVSYETTPVIPASPNTAAGGARPFPSEGSPGKAFWQLLKRYAQELDKFESTVIRTLTDRVVAAETAVSSTTPLMRALVKSDQQNISTGSGARLSWLGAGDSNDPGNPAASADGITLAADGLLTVKKAGLYSLSVTTNLFSNHVLFIRRVDAGAVLTKSAVSSSPNAICQNALARVPANATFDVYVYNNGNSGNTQVPSSITESQTAGGARTVWNIVRLGA